MKIVGAWSSVWIMLAALFGVVRCVNRPIAPKRADVAPTEFSEERAMPIVRYLANEIGIRPNGSPGAEKAAEYLASLLRAIPRVEVDVQHAEGTRFYEHTPFPYPMFRYHVTNVVARLPGKSREAVLLNAHFDTLGDSPGAGDDAVGIAAIVESMRALAAGPMLDRSVIVLCNGGEEYGLLGADGFIRQHPLARDVKAYVYLDGSPGGPATLVQAGPGNPALVEAFAKVAPHPQTSSLFLDLLESGAVAYDGDMRPLNDANAVGLSFAAVGDLYAAHTSRDRAERVEPGTLQHMGETALATARALASEPTLPNGVNHESITFFDVLGVVIVHYRATTAAVLGLLSILAASVCLWWMKKRELITVRGVAMSLLGAVLAMLSAVLSAVVVGLLLAFALRRPHGWYSHTSYLVPAFVAPAMAAFVGVQRRLRARLEARELDPTWNVWGASLVGWGLLLLIATVRSARGGYIPLIWTVSLCAGAFAAMRWKESRWGVGLLSCLPGLLVVMQLTPMVRSVTAQAGYFPAPIPVDPMVGALLGVFTAFLGTVVALSVASLGQEKVVSRVLLGVGAVGVLLCAVSKPYSEERPRRIVVFHAEAGGRSALLLRGMDALPMDDVVKGIPNVRAAQSNWPVFDPFEVTPTYEVPAPVPPFAAPNVKVVSQQENPDGTRTLALHLETETPQVRMYVQKGRLVKWSLGEKLAENEYAGGRNVAYFLGVPKEGERLEITVKGKEPVEIDVVAATFLPTEEMTKLATQLPPWAVISPFVVRLAHVAL